MLNCSVSSIFALGSQLMLEQLAKDPDLVGNEFAHLKQALDADELKQSKGWMKIARDVCTDFELTAALDRIDIIEKRLKKGMSRIDLGIEYRVLKEIIDQGFKGHFIYRYRFDKAKVFEAWTNDWAPALKAFPSARTDIVSAVDLWAMSHSTASVFHSMRVLEHGLRSLASELEVPFSVEVWQTIIEAIEKKIRALGPTLPRGTAKAQRLQFLSEAAKEFFYFKDGWRNYVSHNKSTYDETQARNVLEHVRSFMNNLSQHLSEDQSVA